MIRSSKVLVIKNDGSDISYLEEKLQILSVPFIVSNYDNYFNNIFSNHFDIVIIDSSINSNDFGDICSKIKSNKDFNKIPIIAVIENANSEKLNNSLELGADDYIFRPFNSVELKTRLTNQYKLRTYQLEWEKELHKLESLNKEKNEILAIAAHDLKNPIFSIQLLGKTIRDDNSLTKEEAYEFSNDIVASCDRIIDIIKQLLDLNSIESGKININIATQSIIEPIKHLIELYRFKAENKNIKVNFACNSDGIAKTDIVSLNNVFDNFLSNAIKYSPFDKEVFVYLKDVGEKLVIEISDRGPGIPPAEQDKLFKRFAKISNKPTAGENSTGLGLSIVKKFAELINAEIEFRNNTDSPGATFSVILPKS